MRAFSPSLRRFLFSSALSTLVFFGIVAVLQNLFLLRLGFEARFIGLLLGVGQLVWAVIVKIFSGSNPPSALDFSEIPSAWNYWKREILAYRSGILAELTGNLVAPRCYGVTEHASLLKKWAASPMRSKNNFLTSCFH